MKWDNWTLCKDNYTLTYDENGRYMYEIDLETIQTPAQMLDWIFQIRGKAWASDRAICALLEAFYAIFKPQASLCSYGSSKRITRDHIKELVNHLAAEDKCSS